MSAGNCEPCGGDGWFTLGHWHGNAKERCLNCLGGGRVPPARWRRFLHRLGLLRAMKVPRA